MTTSPGDSADRTTVLQGQRPGTLANVAYRLRTLLPPWFGDDETPNLDALLASLATVPSFAYALYLQAKGETRLATADGGWLELIAGDYFGAGLPRLTGENDNAYRSRIAAAIFVQKATRAALTSALTNLGVTFTLVEPSQPGDTGALNTAGSGYGQAGYYGSRTTPYQAFVIVTLSGSVTQAQVYAAIQAIKPEGVIVWVRFS